MLARRAEQVFIPLSVALEVLTPTHAERPTPSHMLGRAALHTPSNEVATDSASSAESKQASEASEPHISEHSK